jgi:hypothetical protein
MPLQFPRTCFSCGRPDVGTYDVGAVNDSFKACAECFFRHGKRALCLEADRLLAEVYSPKPKAPAPNPTGGRVKLGMCFHCGDPVIQALDGSWPLWCTSCERERKALESRAASA